MMVSGMFAILMTTGTAYLMQTITAPSTPILTRRTRIAMVLVIFVIALRTEPAEVGEVQVAVEVVRVVVAVVTQEVAVPAQEVAAAGEVEVALPVVATAPTLFMPTLSDSLELLLRQD